MEKEKLEFYKEKLLSEKADLETGLSSIGRINPDNPTDWEAKPTEFSDDHSDPNDNADLIEDFENNSAILKQLETQLTAVNEALQKIEKGTYGRCEVCDKMIDEGRLNANFSARTCTEHMRD